MIYSIIIVSLIATTIGSILFLYFEKEFEQNSKEDKIDKIRKRLPPLISKHVYVQDDENIMNTVSGFFYNFSMSYLEIKDDKGRSSLKLGRIDPKKRVVKDIKILYKDPSNQNGKNKYLGEILFQLALSTDKKLFNRNIFTFFLIQFFQLIIISFLFNHMLNKHINNPLKYLLNFLSKEKALDILNKNSHDEIKSNTQNNEINQILISFNNMKKMLHSAFSDLKQENKELEDKLKKISDEDSSKGVILESQNKEI
ncbi:MAG: hypothetical protein VXW15_11480, partial [Bdellovibrionota bacterium]|nr:hypothetical protein [Bdellovibrionota bacterium]